MKKPLKKQKQKLVLSKETVRDLGLAQVQGGALSDNSQTCYLSAETCPQF
jgi:hypothetical protein